MDVADLGSREEGHAASFDYATSAALLGQVKTSRSEAQKKSEGKRKINSQLAISNYHPSIVRSGKLDRTVEVIPRQDKLAPFDFASGQDD